MPIKTPQEMERRLKEIQEEVRWLRRKLRDVEMRGREIVKKSKLRRDEGLLSSVRKQLGLQ